MGIKRSSLDHVKYFKAPFSKVNYSSHNKRMNITKQTKYFELDAGAKKSFLRLAAYTDYRQRCMSMTGLAVFLYIQRPTRKFPI